MPLERDCRRRAERGPILTNPHIPAQKGSRPAAEPLPCPRLSIGVTGHRASHSSYPADSAELDTVLRQLFDRIDTTLARCDADFSESDIATTRLHTLAADGTDQAAAHLALARGWELVISLPFGKVLNSAINARPMTPADARCVLAGSPPADAAVAGRVAAISTLCDAASLFELEDEDERIGAAFLAATDHEGDMAAQRSFALDASARSALAGRILIEQSDLVIAVWDGHSTADIGGTGHTVCVALEMGAPVLWLRPSNLADWRILQAPEALAECGSQADMAENLEWLDAIVRDAVLPEPSRMKGRHIGHAALNAALWRDHSSRSVHAFRRIEAIFGRRGLRQRFGHITQTYEHPDAIAAGSAAPLLGAIDALPGGDPALSRRIGTHVLRRFAWADGISAHLSDRYRSGMTVNFLLGSFAIIAGILYLPLVDTSQKWLFASVEFIMLLLIILITIHGTRERLHGRWFETRRAAEYLRHSPLMLAMGVARPSGAWPRGTKSYWPEWYARHSVRAVGLPRAKIGQPYLREALATLRDGHVLPQRDYHQRKAAQLGRVHEGLDHLSGLLFVAAVFSVAVYLALVAMDASGVIEGGWVAKAAKIFTVLGVALPTLGGALAGIRYFGDFERFASISEVAAEKLNTVADRIALLQNAPENRLNYRHVSELVHATDEVVFSEIQNWQAVFSGKRITVPA